MKKLFLLLVCITTVCSYGQAAYEKNGNNVTISDTPIQCNPAPLDTSPSDTLKIKYIPPKIRISPDTLQLQKEWMEKWKTAVKENKQKEVIEALEKATNYNSGEAYYKLAELYNSGNGVKKDTVQAYFLFYYSAIYGYKPAMELLNSGEGVFMPGGEIAMPQFPGGDEALINYIYTKIREIFTDHDGVVNVQGRAIVRFTVEKDGSIRYAKVVRNDIPYSQHMEKKIMGIFKDMPKWKPATFQGQTVRCLSICPVVVKLMM